MSNTPRSKTTVSKKGIRILQCLAFTAFAASCHAASANWPSYLGDKGASHFSTLMDITPENATQLREAWVFRSGDSTAGSRIQCNPLVIDGILYATTAGLQVVALDGATGRELWRHRAEGANGVSRGLAFWKNAKGGRIFFSSGKWLNALDARTGSLIAEFGDGGRVDLSDNLGRDDVAGLVIQANTPGIIFENLIIMGMRVGEGPGPAAPGPIRAYDVRTGKLAWRFDTIPRPGQIGYDTWPKDAWTRIGGANVWAGFALDEERGVVYCPVGSAAFDFWGGDRLGDNLFANCLLALNARTGQRLWHYQLIHHDLWDRDPPAPPTLLTVKRDGRDIPAVAQVTKTGHVFVFNRVTGEPLFPVDEVPVPAARLEGDVASRTQPLPRKPEPFARQLFNEAEVTDRTPEARRYVLERLAALPKHERFATPSKEGTIIFPGFDGGAEWGGAAADPSGVLYVNSNETAWLLSMRRLDDSKLPGEKLYLQNCASCHGILRDGNPTSNVPGLQDLAQRMTEKDAHAVLANGRNAMPAWTFLTLEQRESLVAFLFGREQAAPATEDAAQHADAINPKSALPPFTHAGYKRFLDKDGYPAVRPPWGTLNAIDLNTGEYRWRVPLGEYEELTAKGIAKTGAESYGGPVVTAGGVVIIAATKDQCIRVFDAKDGRELWKAKLPAAGFATPTTYAVKGKQYVVIACGGGKMRLPSGDAYVAFALP